VERVLAELPYARIRVHIHALRRMDGTVPVDLRAVLNLPVGMHAPLEGDTFLFRAKLHRPRVSRFPGDMDARAALGGKSVDLTGTVVAPSHAAVLSPGVPMSALEAVLFQARASTRDLIRTSLPEDAATLTEAFVLGDSPWLDDSLRAPFDAAGASHLLAVSGLQATLLASLLFALLRFLWGRVPFLLRRVDPAPAAALLCIPAIFLYAAYAGGAASVVRSAWMAAAVMLGVLSRRKSATAQTLGLGAMLMLLWEPRVIHDAGFLLSFLSVLSLVLLAPGLLAALRGPTETASSTKNQVLAVLATSLAAYLATLPLVVHLFGRVATYGVFTNLLLVPLGGMALPFVVVVALLATAFHSVFLMKVAGAVSVSLLDLCSAFAKLPNAQVELRSPGVGLVVLAMAGALLCGVGNRKALLAGCLTMAVGLLGLIPAQVPPPRLTVMIAPVGQGDGAILRLPDGSAAVIDGGGSFISAVDPGKTVMTPLLERMGVTRLELMILSHPHPDHHNGLVSLVQRFKPRQFWWNGQPSRHPRFLALQQALRDAGTQVVTFERAPPDGFPTRSVGGATFTILHPLPLRDGPDAPRHYPELGENDNSLTVRISHAGHTVLFPGDIERDAEDLLAKDPEVLPWLRADLLKVPHHGSVTSTSDVLLDAVKPQHALMGVGVDNQWHFPHPDVVDRLSAHHVDLWRTDQDGLITAELDEDGVRVSAYAR
jgi:competence protein ComEC